MTLLVFDDAVADPRTAGEVQPFQNPTYAIDGNGSTFASSDSGASWGNHFRAIDLHLESTSDVYSITTNINYCGGFADPPIIQTSVDGSTWTTQSFSSASSGGYRVHTLTTPASGVNWIALADQGFGLHFFCWFQVFDVFADGEPEPTPPPPDPLPAAKLEIDGVEFTGIKELTFRAALNDAGSFHAVINRGDPQATAANIRRGAIVQITVLQIHSDVLWEGILETGDFDLLKTGEEGAEDLSFGGPGTLAIFKRCVMDFTQYIGSRREVFPSKGYWKFSNSAGPRTEGDIIKRIVEESETVARPGSILPDITRTFSNTLDSDGVDWGDEEFEGSWHVPIGANVYDELIRIANGGFVMIDMAPGFVMNAYRDFGRDLTGDDFAEGAVRFEKGVNLVDDLARSMLGAQWATRAVVHYPGDDTAVDGWTRAAIGGTLPYEQEMFVESSASSQYTARRQAQGLMRLRYDAQEAILASVLSPHTGEARSWVPDPDSRVRYLPGPEWSDNGMYWVGDTITLHTGDGDFEYEDTPQRVWAITIGLDPDTGELAIPVVELNAPYRRPGQDGDLSATGGPRASTGTSGGGTGGSSGPTPSHFHTQYQAISDVTWKQAVRAATTANVTIATGLNVGDVVDGVTLADGDRVLVKDQTAAEQNGIYVASEGPSRAEDLDFAAEVPGAIVHVYRGTVNEGTTWRTTNTTPPVIDTDDIDWEQFGGSVDYGETGDVTTLDYDDAPDAGVLDEVARADHLHGMPSEGAGGAGGSPLGRTQYGTTAMGTSFDTSSRIASKLVTLTEAGLIASISAGVKGNGSNVFGLSVALFANNAGVPGQLLAVGAGDSYVDVAGPDHTLNIYTTTTAQFVAQPLGYWAAAGSYWIAVSTQMNSTAGQLAYEAGGSDYSRAGGYYWSDVSLEAQTNSTRNHSIYCDVLSGGGAASLSALGHTYLGKTTAGASFDNPAAVKTVAKQVTPSSDGVLASIGVHVKGNGTNAGMLTVALYADSAGSVGNLVALNSSALYDQSAGSPNYNIFLTSTARWVDIPIAAKLTGGTPYWLAYWLDDNTASTQVAYDSGGSDRSASYGWVGDAGTPGWSDSTRSYSIRGGFLGTTTTGGAIGSAELVATGNTTIPNTNVYTDVTGASVALAAGTWIGVGVISARPSTSTSAFYLEHRLTNSAASTEYSLGNFLVGPDNEGNAGRAAGPVVALPFTLSESTTVKLQARTGGGAGNAQVSGSAEPSLTNVVFVRTDVGGGSSRGASVMRLDYQYAGADLAGASIGSSTWTDIVGASNFEVSSTASNVEFILNIGVQARTTTADRDIKTRFLVDGATAVPIAGWHMFSTQYHGAPGGSAYLTGLSAGTHTVKPQMFTNGAGGDYYLRPTASAGAEFLRLQVVEHYAAAAPPTSAVGVRVYRASTLTPTADNNYYAIAFDNEEYDTDGFHDNASNNSRLTVPAGMGGRYSVQGTTGAVASVAAGNYANLAVRKNGSTMIRGTRQGPAHDNNGMKFGVTQAVVDLVAGDYLELLYVTNNATTWGSASDLDRMTTFEMHKTDQPALGTPPGASAYRTTVESKATATFTSAALDAEDFDSDGYHDNVTNNSRMTVPAGLGGRYYVEGRAHFASSATGVRYLQLYKNGTLVRDQTAEPVSGGDETRMVNSAVLDLVAGDYISLAPAHSVGSNLNITAATQRLTVLRLGGGAALSFRGAAARASAATNVNNITFTALAYGATDAWDTDGFHDPSSNNTRMTIPAGLSGLYQITVVTNWDGNGSGERILGYQVNGGGTVYGSRITTGTSNMVLNFTRELMLNAGDYVEVMVYQGSGGTRTANAVQGVYDEFSIRKVG